MSTLAAAIGPIFLMIALGWALKASGFIAAGQWPPIEKITYFVLYPGFLLPAVWKADFSSVSAGPLGGATVLGVSLIAGLLLLSRPWFGLTGPAFTSVFQGALRWNSFVFLPIVMSLFGPKGTGLAALVLGALIPAINVMCVLVLSRWGQDQGRGWRDALSALAQNPILWACGLGAFLNLMGMPKISPVMTGLQLLSDAALTLGLITAGAGLDFADARSRPGLIVSVAAIKLLVLPILMWTFCRWLGGDPLAQDIALICGASPGAAASYVLARRMGGDAPLMAGIVASTTAASVLTIPLLLAIFPKG